MKRILVLLIFFPLCFFLKAQPVIKNKKYPSLLWEITGNGLQKPSYLFGTMHVSSKIAFHLADSFYLAIRSADVVALETNPESWQDDLDKYEIDYGLGDYKSSYNGFLSVPDEYLRISTLKFFSYDKKIERSLYNSPSVINNLLYRSYGNESSDFEEDTYLDMYIYQCGKKWNKKITGVEKYAESMRLMSEGYKDAAKDKNKKERSFDGEEGYSQDKIQEAYRSGNLDLLDSINHYNSFSDAFDEKFIYRRNEIQAHSIDSILKSGSVLFVGVGAAHLPGNRGVIEFLRKKGYHLRPVKIGERDSRDKEELEKIRVPVSFATQVSDDGLFKVDVPGKLYKYGKDGSLDQRQYADMANGSYYIITRMMTNAWMWGNSTEDVYKKVDSLLYENIPGKILSKQTIFRNGVKGFDIMNRTRRGDMQRYNIFITPFEIIFFKMSGNDDYVKNGDEAKKFFGSIRFNTYKTDGKWKKWSPSFGGFSVDLPHEPYIGNDGSWIFDAMDSMSDTYYRIVRSDIHNYNFAEQDSFDLRLMEESFAASEFIGKEESRKPIIYKGYPALDCKFRNKNGSVYLARFLIQGPHYYTLIAFGKKDDPGLNKFLNSFEIKPYQYGEIKERKDTSLFYSVRTPFYPEDKKEKISMASHSYYDSDDDDDDDSGNNFSDEGIFRGKTIVNDSTGEKIFVSFFRSLRYYYSKDSTGMEKGNNYATSDDSDWIIRNKKEYELPGKMKIWEKQMTNAGSSRMICSKTFYKNGFGFLLMTESDTLSGLSSFVKNFFDNFKPADNIKGFDPFEKKSTIFFRDFFDKDTVIHKRALKGLSQIALDSTDLFMLRSAITTLGWNEKKYLDVKTSLINKLSDIKTHEASDLLKDIYYQAADTVELQYAALENLLQQQTPYSYRLFGNIISTDPPVIDLSSKDHSDFSSFNFLKQYQHLKKYYSGNNNFLDELSDSLQLTHTILPELLPLLNLNDYKEAIMNLLGQMVDSDLVSPKDYEMYFSKFLIEAKQELKKQKVAEKKKEIQKAEQIRDQDKMSSLYDDDNDQKDDGNDDLSLYATLLLPFFDNSTPVQSVFQQMLSSNDKQLKYKTLMLLIRHDKNYPDSILKYFASLDEYRYPLYEELKEMKKKDKFPSAFNNHIDLAKSCLLEKKSYSKPDSFTYLKRLETKYNNKSGFIYFFKYKEKKDDMNWRIATVGLVPQDPKDFEFNDSGKVKPVNSLISYSDWKNSDYDFTEFTNTRIKDDEPISDQLNKVLKKLLYSRHKSAKEFYKEEEDSNEMYDIVPPRLRY